MVNLININVIAVRFALFVVTLFFSTNPVLGILYGTPVMPPGLLEQPMNVAGRE